MEEPAPAHSLPDRRLSHHHPHAQDTSEQHLFDGLEPVSFLSHKYQSSYHRQEAQQHISLWPTNGDRLHPSLLDPGTTDLWPNDPAYSTMHTRGWSLEPGLSNAASCSLHTLGAGPLAVVAVEACSSPGLVI